LIKLLIGEYQKQKGDIFYFDSTDSAAELKGCDPCDLNFKSHLGYQASDMQALDNLTSLEYLQLCCELKNLPPNILNEQIKLVVKQWHLFEIIDKPMQQLSQGNLQKLAIAQAFLAQPDFIILDEPTQALDPLEQKRFIDNLNHLNSFKLQVPLGVSGK